ASLYTKIRNIVDPQLLGNPCFGPNIKKLKGELDGFYRYRIGSYRLFYLIENDQVLVMILDIRHRQGAYR
ncbi:MAG: type II toxin-antitoxin system RelE family toxin, partial [bacterium]